ncbi:glycosyltransferase [Pseudoscardovia radai]|uniref:glycosyltransferase n=1 Tax=Pseudoscardovia radai TaxID=987066 RepID=UPI00399509E3
MSASTDGVTPPSADDFDDDSRASGQAGMGSAVPGDRDDAVPDDTEATDADDTDLDDMDLDELDPDDLGTDLGTEDLDPGELDEALGLEDGLEAYEDPDPYDDADGFGTDGDDSQIPGPAVPGADAGADFLAPDEASVEEAQRLAQRLAIVIVTYNRPKAMEELFDNLRRLDVHPWRIIVVDNANDSAMRSATVDFGRSIAALWDDDEWTGDPRTDRVVYMPRSKNLGPAGGFNAGMKKAYKLGAEWFWLLDDDVLVDIDALEKLAAWMPAHDMIQGVRIDTDDNPVTDEGDFSPATGLLSPMPRTRFGRGGYRVVNAVSFEGLLVSRRVVDQIGLPDPRFFMYGDDTMYGYLASRVTNPVAVYDAILYRTRSDSDRAAMSLRSLGKGSDRERYQIMRNRGYIARYLMQCGSYSPLLFAIGTCVTAHREIVRLVATDRAGFIPGAIEVFKGWLAARRIMHDPDWKPMTPLGSLTRG